MSDPVLYHAVPSRSMVVRALMPVLPRYPELLAYWERLEQRPGWRRAHEADQKIMSAKEA